MRIAIRKIGGKSSYQLENREICCLARLTRPRLKKDKSVFKGFGEIKRVEKGFNSDVSWKGDAYHVQTEDWGRGNPFLVSRVFRDGAVLKSIKNSYIEVLPRGPASDAKAIKLAMKLQHQQILDLLLSGQLL